MSLKDNLEEIRVKLVEISGKLDLLLNETKAKEKPTISNTLASLPDHLRKTASAVLALGEATAEQVADKTGRTRAGESDYLNQLVGRGFLKRERRGKQVYFQVFTLYTTCPKCNARVLMTLSNCAICGAHL